MFFLFGLNILQIDSILREMDNFQGREMSYDIDMYLVS